MFDPSKLNLDEETQKNEEPLQELPTLEKETVEKAETPKTEAAKTEVQKEAPVDPLGTIENYSPKKTVSSEPKIEKKQAEPAKSQVVFDVNITSLQDIVQLIRNNDYDFVTFEPDSEKVTVIFRKDKAIASQKYIPYPTYSTILLKAKAAAKLELGVVNEAQEGKSQAIIDNVNFDVLAKTVPSKTGEKLFFKIKQSESQERVKKKEKKSNLAQMLGFLGAVLIILLIIGGGFLSFVVLNAQTVEDVRFFESLGINLNQINNFIGIIVTVTFLAILFFEGVALIVSLFKFLLTKKAFRQKKIKYGILSAILFIVTFSTASGWLFIDKKVRELPDWALQAYGEVIVYDNAILKSDNELGLEAIVQDMSALIGPVELKFDVTNLEKREAKKGLEIKKYKWKFNDEEVTTLEPTLIRQFDQKGITNIALVVEELDASGQLVEKTIENMPQLNVSYLVDISYRPVASGGNYVTLDASDLEVLGKAEWYDLANTSEPKFTGNPYITEKPITEESFIGLYMRNQTREDNVLDQIFILKGEEKKELRADIDFKSSTIDDLEYTFSAKDIVNDAGSGGIATFFWNINGKEYTKEADFINLESSSEITHSFKDYGTQNISLTITNIAGDSETITKEITIRKNLDLSKNLTIKSDGNLIEDVRYDPELNEYFIDNLAVPAVMEYDARYVKASNPIYKLAGVRFDYDADGNFDETTKTATQRILTEGSHTVVVEYTFEHLRNKADKVTLTETLYLESVKKDAIIDFKMIPNSEYVPTSVKLDASKSSVTGKNISKFIWDFGDGEELVGDSIIEGHYYRTAGDYDVKLTVVTSDGSRYEHTKKLILKPTPQEAKIKVSMKSVETMQAIDFSSAGSSGEIIEYFWDFGDENTSNKANPSHFYTKPGDYEVRLRLDYRNNNFKEATQKITVY